MSTLRPSPRYNVSMPFHAIEIDPVKLTLTVRDPALFKVAELVVKDLGIGQSYKRGDCLLIQCANADDLSLLGTA